MVEFEYQPWKKIIIHEIVEYRLEEMMNIQVQGVAEGGTTRPISWANGILFHHHSMPPTEDIVREQIKGILHWSSLQYAKMPKYVSSVIRARRITIPVIDLSNHVIFGQMTDWLKEQR